MYNAQKVATLFDNAVRGFTRIGDLVLDAGTQCRAKLNTEQAENYAANMLAGKAKDFPAVKVARLIESVQMKDGSLLEAGALVLVDGFHRIEGAHSAKLETFQSETVDCDLETAIYYAMQANSTNGLSLAGKDYQNAIRKLYSMDKAWREHGKKKEIAALFGCSEKTVQRATVAIDKETKAESFKMFERGYSDQDVSDYAVITLQTAQAWRKEWEESKVEKPQGAGDGEGQGQGGDDTNAGTNNPLDLTFAQVLALKNSQLKAQLLKMLMDSIKQDAGQAKEEPKAAQDDEPPFDADDKEPEAPEGVKDNGAAELAKKWRGLTCWEIMGLERDKLAAMANPKAAIKRAFAKALKECHPDHYGENEACEMLKNAQDEILKYFR